MSQSVSRLVSRECLRRMFNDGRFYERLQEGALRSRVKAIGDPPEAHEMPSGTKSHMVWYYNLEGELVAKVHQYVRSDGRLAGSGIERPDPKKIKMGEVWYHEPRKGQKAGDCPPWDDGVAGGS